MRAGQKGRDELAVRVRTALSLPTKKETEHVVNLVVCSLETTLLNNLEANGFTLKLNSFGKFSVRHKAGILKKVPFAGKTVQKKRSGSSAWEALRQRERVDR
jgi:nucleoid DNA-binding protein